MSRRREPRVEISFEVKAWGLDRHGKPFMQRARTLDITKQGARLIGIDCVKVGEIIGIQNGDQKARFKVVWLGRENTPKAGQIGVHSLEPDKNIFVHPPQKAQAEPIFFQAAAGESGFEPVKNVRPVRQDMAAVRRKDPRYPCTGGVELRQHESGPLAWGNITDVSLTGCYVETTSTLPVGSMVLFHLRTHNLEVKGRAVVKASHHAVGMGLAFVNLSQENQQTLEFLIGTLAGIQEMRPEEKQTFLAPDLSPKSAQPPAAKTLIAESGLLSAQVTRTIAELTELEQSLARDRVDPRLIAQFHDAVEHTRQAACTVQRWLDLRSRGEDPFSVLPQLETERISMFVKLSHHVLADLEATGLTEFSPGIKELWQVVQNLHKHLAKLFMHLPGDGEHGRKVSGAKH